MSNCHAKLDSLVVSVSTKLSERGYKPVTIQRHQRLWENLGRYMEKQEVTTYTPDIGFLFLREFYEITVSEKLTKQERAHARSIKLLNDFLETGTIFPMEPKVSTVSALKLFGYLLADFKQFQQDKFSMTSTTLKNYDRYISRFLLYLEAHISEISMITPVLIINYCKILVEYAEGLTYNATCCMRVFLRYLYATEKVTMDYSSKVPNLTYRRKSRLPSVFTDEEVMKILDSIDRSNAVGKRDYAIILLARRLGLRSGDIRTLEFKHIHWERNIIEKTMQKTGKLLTLPLLEDVGAALIDYIKYARPAVSSPIVFWNCNAPMKPLSQQSIAQVLKRAANQASVNSAPDRSTGPHALRSTLASVMLSKDVPLPIISGILGHSDTHTTLEYYLRIDKKQLQRCGLEVPRFSWEANEEVF